MGIIEAELAARGLLQQALVGIRELPLDVILPETLDLADLVDRALDDGHVSAAEALQLGRAFLAVISHARRVREQRRPPPELARDPVETVTTEGVSYPPSEHPVPNPAAVFAGG